MQVVYRARRAESNAMKPSLCARNAPLVESNAEATRGISYGGRSENQPIDHSVQPQPKATDLLLQQLVLRHEELLMQQSFRRW